MIRLAIYPQVGIFHLHGGQQKSKPVFQISLSIT